MPLIDPVQLFRKLIPLIVTALVLITVSIAADPVERSLAANTKTAELQIDRLTDSAGQGVILGMIGGFRTIVADFSWIRANIAWMDAELAETMALIQLTTTIDPYTIYFWRDGARMIVYDFAHWRFNSMGGYLKVAEPIRKEIFREEAMRGIAYLDQGLAVNPGNPTLLAEKAMVYQNKLEDFAKAGELYEEAARQPGASYFPGRMAAIMYVEAGLNDRAYKWLETYLPTLPPESESPRSGRQELEMIFEALKSGKL